MRVAGVDAALGGWIAVLLDESGFAQAALFVDFEAVVHQLSDASVVGVDIPIGLPAEGRRPADLAARAFVGPRRSSVFFAPPRAAFDEETYAAARLRFPGISAQTWALRRAIVDVERHASDPRVHEIHPEVSFRAMHGEELPYPKRTWNGLQLRIRLLRDAGIRLPEGMDAGIAPADDVVDAAAVAWTARRVASGEAKTLPVEPEPGEPRITY